MARVDEPDQVEGSDIPPPSGLSPLQIAWARHYVEQAGRKGAPLRAAIKAGYSRPSARQSAWKNTLHPQIQAYVATIARARLNSKLPELLAAQVALALDPKTPAATRAKLLASLTEQAGGQPAQGSVAVQVNVSMNGGAAQRVIGEVWDVRSRRLGDLSVIPIPMTDSEAPMAEASATHRLTGHDDGRPGGGCPLGSHPGNLSHTSPSGRTFPETDEFGVDDGSALESREFSAAAPGFGDGGLCGPRGLGDGADGVGGCSSEDGLAPSVAAASGSPGLVSMFDEEEGDGGRPDDAARSGTGIAGPGLGDGSDAGEVWRQLTAARAGAADE